MKGWKTWIAALCMAALGIMSIIDGNLETGLQQIVGGLALVGLGHKLDKGSFDNRAEKRISSTRRRSSTPYFETPEKPEPISSTAIRAE